MDRLQIELKRIAREIQRYGKTYTVKREVLDDYKEPTGDIEEVTIVGGLFHTEKGYQTRSVSDGTVTHSKGSPMLLCEYESTLDIKQGDFIEINGNKYKVIAKNNIQEYNIICDISMELVLNGNQS